jgi:hypothetical protein
MFFGGPKKGYTCKMIAKKEGKKNTHKEYTSNICKEDILLLLDEVMEDPFIHHM